MYPASFEYHRAASVEEAVGLLTRYKDDAKLLAGGHSLIPMMKLRLAQPKHLIDLGRVGGLAGIKEEGGNFVIGAMTTHYAVESSAAVKPEVPHAVRGGGADRRPAGAQLRDGRRQRGPRGSGRGLAGTRCIALGAEIKAVGPKGARTIKADDFFKDLFTTALGADEILTEIRIPTGGHGGAAYMKYPHPASRFAVVRGRGGGLARRRRQVHGGARRRHRRRLARDPGQGRRGGPHRQDARRGDHRRGLREGGRGHRDQRRPPGLGRVQGASDARVHASRAREGGRASEGREVALSRHLPGRRTGNDRDGPVADLSPGRGSSSLDDVSIRR